MISTLDHRLSKAGKPLRYQTSRRSRYSVCRQEDPLIRPPGPGNFPGLRRPFRSLAWLLQVFIGVAFLVLLLAALAALPVFSLLALGFILRAEADVAENKRLRSGFPLLPVSSRFGMIGLMVFLFILPIMLSSSSAGSQVVISQLSGTDRKGMILLTRILQPLIFIHLLLAVARGGHFTDFFRPFRSLKLLRADLRSGLLAARIDSAIQYVLKILQPWEHFKLAFFAALGALCWLAIPVGLLASTPSAPRVEPGLPGLLSFVGGVLLIPVAAWLPLLQCHQVIERRFFAIFEVRKIRELICRVPIRWAVATILLYGLAIPLYLSKVVLPPADAFWMFTPLFILVIYPTRLLIGWVYGAGEAKEKRARRVVRWPVKLAMLPLLAAYAFLIFLLPFVSEEGPRVMLENHAILLPVPSGQFSP